ncbi:MAG: hypothetical protein FJ347_02760 [Sphingomonadales bacterium]|nr:hypothetical protein [Sphingomonadales bacterium]
MGRYIIVLLLLMLMGVYFPLNAQRPKLYQHFNLGNSMFLGDLGGRPTIGTNGPQDLNLQTMRYSIGTGLKLAFSPGVALKTNLTYARVAGNDKFTLNRERGMRNLNFFSPIVNTSLMLELSPGESKRLYMFAGAGFFYYEPKTRLGGTKYRLRDYGTEGQYFIPGKEPYRPTAVIFPFGLGYKIKDGGRGGASLSIEYVMNKSTTDYIDDVSTNYVDKTTLANRNGAVAVQLMDRSVSNIPGFGGVGAIRGDPRDMDNFSFLQVVYSAPLGKARGSGFGGKKYRRRPNTRCPDRF